MIMLYSYCHNTIIVGVTCPRRIYSPFFVAFGSEKTTDHNLFVFDGTQNRNKKTAGTFSVRYCSKLFELIPHYLPRIFAWGMYPYFKTKKKSGNSVTFRSVTGPDFFFSLLYGLRWYVMICKKKLKNRKFGKTWEKLEAVWFSCDS